MKMTWEHVKALVILLIALSAMGILIYTSLRPEPPLQFNVNITGEGSANYSSSTLAQLHFECIKFCVEKAGHDYRRRCYESCALLGKEGCEK